MRTYVVLGLILACVLVVLGKDDHKHGYKVKKSDKIKLDVKFSHGIGKHDHKGKKFNHLKMKEVFAYFL